ncbi:hypothetical protein I3842_02G051000 [Carya illinoinensis]|uniref:Uncharacterized protein n=1 Tax=Carya illinoinensis TaxID=32201 RepID=A0A922FSA7_CARIL|nr:hypothetical protein I3842_02G051000 [Carya illinoinensis]
MGAGRELKALTHQQEQHHSHTAGALMLFFVRWVLGWQTSRMAQEKKGILFRLSGKRATTFSFSQATFRSFEEEIRIERIGERSTEFSTTRNEGK